MKGDQKRAVAEYKAAVRDLEALQVEQARQGIRAENPAYHAAHDRVFGAAQKVNALRALALIVSGH
ncbi:hypothetical protein HPO96_17435 [Kribbella sandramycini]|uniref:Uncharacterized protein n=1 Tax=Kribbella sandramycini TaxID=60450 RepID=A0A7Y4L2L0_9ACTN|nr:hypothetical protein [Kribbella sandramycini]MBB6565769.1 hypothetical protein [Kribbella sandramycini]NOL42031.1 hypothetical protein [Kribbella sandramycini]